MIGTLYVVLVRKLGGGSVTQPVFWDKEKRHVRQKPLDNKRNGDSILDRHCYQLPVLVKIKGNEMEDLLIVGDGLVIWTLFSIFVTYKPRKQGKRMSVQTFLMIMIVFLCLFKAYLSGDLVYVAGLIIGGITGSVIVLCLVRYTGPSSRLQVCKRRNEMSGKNNSIDEKIAKHNRETFNPREQMQGMDTIYIVGLLVVLVVTILAILQVHHYSMSQKGNPNEIFRPCRDSVRNHVLSCDDVVGHIPGIIGPS